MEIKYFAYGSNLSHGQMRLRCPAAVPVGPARLIGYRLVFASKSDRWGGAVADVRPEDEWYVQGGLYRMTGKDLKLLDKFEGYPDFYIREEKRILLPSGEFEIALMYRMADAHVIGRPSRAYLETIIRGFNDFSMVPTPEVSAAEYID